MMTCPGDAKMTSNEQEIEVEMDAPMAERRVAQWYGGINKPADAKINQLDEQTNQQMHSGSLHGQTDEKQTKESHERTAYGDSTDAW